MKDWHVQARKAVDTKGKVVMKWRVLIHKHDEEPNALYNACSKLKDGTWACMSCGMEAPEDMAFLADLSDCTRNTPGSWLS